MILKIIGFENAVKFNCQNINIIEINNPKCFSHILEVLNNKIHGQEENEMFLLDENDEELNMNKEMYIAFDLFNIDYNSKRILGKLYEIIEENVKKNQDYKVENMMLNVRNCLIEEINELPFEFAMKQELEITEILKLFNLKIDNQNYTSVLERVEILIDIIATLKIAKILVIPNLKQYLSEEETVELYKYSLYNNVNLLLIERENSKKLKYEQVLRIDEEYDEQIV